MGQIVATISHSCTAEALCVQGSACTRTRCSSRVSTRSSPTTRPRRRPARRHSSSSVRHDHLNDIEDLCGALGSLSGMAVEGRGAAHCTRPSAGPRRAVCQVLVHRQPFPPEVPLDGVSKIALLSRFVSLSVSLTRKVSLLQQLDRRRNRPRGGRLEDVRAVRRHADLLQCGQRRPAPHGE